MQHNRRSGPTQSNGLGFLKDNAELVGIAMRFFDLTLVVVGAMIAYYIRSDQFALPYFYKIALIILLFGVSVVFPLFDVYKPWRGASIWDEIRSLLLAWFLVAATIPVLLYFTKTGELYSRLWFGWWTLITALLMVGSRFVVRKASNWARQTGLNTRNVLIVGTGELAQQVCENLRQSGWTGINVVGYVDAGEGNKGRFVGDTPVIGNIDDLEQLLFNRSLEMSESANSILDYDEIDQVWVALPTNRENDIRRVCEMLEESAIAAVFVPDIFLHSLLNKSVDEFAGMPVVNLRATPIAGFASTIKMAEDILVSLAALVFFAPIMLLIAVLIKLESPGPVLFKQRRYGIDGKEILVWKFRTMRVLEDGNTVTQARKNDRRVTRVGSFLRRSSLDELPQFFNVLQGKMSVVGPRPHAVAHNEQYRKLVDHYMLRCAIKPGITGWAQVNGWRGETDTIEKMRKRVEFDIVYLNSWSIWLDAKIILKTITRAMFNQNAY